MARPSAVSRRDRGMKNTFVMQVWLTLWISLVDQSQKSGIDRVKMSCEMVRVCKPISVLRKNQHILNSQRSIHSVVQIYGLLMFFQKPKGGEGPLVLIFPYKLRSDLAVFTKKEWTV